MNTRAENPQHRRSIRLSEYDYSNEGFYFVTICVHEHRPLFGTIVDGTMHLNAAGRMVEEWYYRLADKYPHITCREHVVMPNHFHAIIQICSSVGAGFARPMTSTGNRTQNCRGGPMCPPEHIPVSTPIHISIISVISVK